VDRLRQRLSVAGQAAATLRELAVRTAPSKIERDAAIQRFEYSFEATWKAAQRFLAVVEGVEAGSPKSAIRLDRDLPEHGLRKGDLGSVVEVYEPDGLEVEFVTASGRSAALLTLNGRDVRPVSDDDLVSVRPCRRSAGS